MTDWQLIETAPKDGAPILVSNGRDMAVCDWHTAAKSPYNPIVAAMSNNAEGGYWRIGGSAFKFDPTHWMPLPASPMGS